MYTLTLYFLHSKFLRRCGMRVIICIVHVIIHSARDICIVHVIPYASS